MPDRIGIYEIVNAVNGKRYIGSAIDFKARWRLHSKNLRNNKHHSRHLQRAWNKHGRTVFEFRKLLVCGTENLMMYEQLCLDELKPEYNISPTAGSQVGVKRSLEFCAALGRRVRGNKYALGWVPSDEWRVRQAQYMRGNKYSLGLKRSPETRAKMAVAQIGNKHFLGKVCSPEHRAKISLANRGRKRSPEARAKMSEAHLGKPLSPENRANMSKSMIAHWRIRRLKKNAG